MFFLLLSDPYYVEQGNDGCEQFKHVSFINKFILQFKRQQALIFQENSCCFRLCMVFFQVELTFGGHDSISREGGIGWSFCRRQIIYFNPARRRGVNFKFYDMFI